MRAHTHACTHTYPETHPRAHARTHARTPTQPRTHPQSRARTLAHTHAHPHNHTRTYAHTRAHACTCAHTQGAYPRSQTTQRSLPARAREFKEEGQACVLSLVGPAEENHSVRQHIRSHESADCEISRLRNAYYSIPHDKLHQPLSFSPESHATHKAEARAFCVVMSSIEVSSWAKSIIHGVLHTHTNARAHTRTHTRTRTHIHTHVQPQPQGF